MFCQSRVVCCIFYSLDDIQLFINKFQFADYEYAYIYHDKDKNDDGTDKEPHYHFYGRRKSPITEQSLKSFRKLCTQNYFYENLKSNEGALLEYFTHSHNNDKFQYPLSDIIANFDLNLRFRTSLSDDKVDPSIIVKMYDDGYSTLAIIRKFPKLLYSIASLQRLEKLVMFERNKYDKTVQKPFFDTSKQDNFVLADDIDSPF